MNAAQFLNINARFIKLFACPTESMLTRVKCWHGILSVNITTTSQSKACRIYKARFALLPTVDHLGDGKGPADFKICGWRTNDAKGDLLLEDFVALCSRVVSAHSACHKPSGAGSL